MNSELASHKDDPGLIDSCYSQKNLTSFVDESLSKLSSALALDNQSNMVDPTEPITSSCINCPTCNQMGQPLVTENVCQQLPITCSTSNNNLEHGLIESYDQNAIHKDQHTEVVANLQQSTVNYITDNRSVTTNIINPPYNYQYHAIRAPYSYSATSSYLQSLTNRPLYYGPNSYQQQPPMNYNEYFWGPN